MDLEQGPNQVYISILVRGATKAQFRRFPLRLWRLRVIRRANDTIASNDPSGTPLRSEAIWRTKRE